MKNFNTTTFKQVIFGRLQNFDLSNSSQWQALSAAIIHTAKHLLKFCWCFCATVAQKSPQKSVNTTQNSTGMSVNLVVCVLAVLSLSGAEKGRGQLCWLVQKRTASSSQPSQATTLAQAPSPCQRRGRLSAYAVLPYIFPEYADCQKTLVGASIARPCPFVCEKTFRENALLRQAGGDQWSPLHIQ